MKNVKAVNNWTQEILSRSGRYRLSTDDENIIMIEYFLIFIDGRNRVQSSSTMHGGRIYNFSEKTDRVVNDENSHKVIPKTITVLVKVLLTSREQGLRSTDYIFDTPQRTNRCLFRFFGKSEQERNYYNHFWCEVKGTRHGTIVYLVDKGLFRRTN